MGDIMENRISKQFLKKAMQHSKTYTIDGYTLRYNFITDELELRDNGDVIYSKIFDDTTFKDNPERSCRTFLKTVPKDILEELNQNFIN